MLWYATYLALHAPIKPDVLLIQLNYQNFANAGVRDGMLELLTDTDFRKGCEGSRPIWTALLRHVLRGPPPV